MRKAAIEGRRAQVAEALVLVLTAAWVTHLVQKEEQQESGAAVSLKAEQRLLQRERDAGLVVGCMLPPLVLLSRLLAEIYQEETFSCFTFFYAWTSISIGVSLLFKVAVFGTATSFSVNILVDVVLLPVVFGLLSPVEAEWRFLLSTGGRVIVAVVLAAAAVVVGGVVYPWSCFLLQTWNPFAWLSDFLTESSSSSSLPLPPRFALMGYWATCLVILVPTFGFISNRFALRNIVARKLFHLLVVLMLGPASLCDAPMLSLSYGVALSVFFLVECVRALSLPPFGRSIAEFMRSFIDYREAGRVILTHSYLLLGCALPLWLVPASITPSPLIMNAGVVALGVGDAMGALVGSSIGKRKIFGSKTVEGSAAVFLSMTLASISLQNYHMSSFVSGEYTQVLLLTAAVFLTTVLEAATAQIDNLVLPLFFYAACNLVGCHRV
ncbi:hypothetical protein JG687_00009408 [Phytophthora cactorum]|uniref:dolichol kinase n=1 Tax=Phytophthora cactorum TaxID=29920 RepID=A0A8T1UC90_9STRA|nr:hypothetical protein JG687_00009408 [Phytophthora cactorum]